MSASDNDNTGGTTEGRIHSVTFSRKIVALFNLRLVQAFRIAAISLLMRSTNRWCQEVLSIMETRLYGFIKVHTLRSV